MSYLRAFTQRQLSPPPLPGKSINSSSRKTKNSAPKDLREAKEDANEEYMEVNFKGLKLNNYSMHSVISTLSERIEAIDLSHNRIEDLPHGLPKSILGLNLAYNKIQKFTVPKDLNHLIELNLSHNHISRYESYFSFPSISSNLVMVA
jgi:Leucine-rich repeat (LRR) protein